MLKVEQLHKKFGGIHAVNNVSLEIKEGSILGLIGPNGAGKTTLFNLITGIINPSSGRILLDNNNITKLKPYELFLKGVIRTFQIPKEFSSLTVKENLMMVPPYQSGENLLNALFYSTKISYEEENISKKADEIINFLELNQVKNEIAGNLSGGQKKLLELARTIMVKPKIIFLDEVGAGVNKTLLNKIIKSIKQLNKQFNYTFCIIEHDMDLISRLCNEIIVMSEGGILATGRVKDIMENEKVIEAYLGIDTNN